MESAAPQLAFTERQLFIRYWWWALLVPALIIPLVFAAAAHQSQSSLTRPQLILVLVLVGLVVGLLVSLRLDVRLDVTGVHYRMMPLQPTWRHRPWSVVTLAYVRTYDPIGEYGGWGLKGRRRDWALNVAGGDGIQLELTDGTRLLLGTQRPAEARQVLELLGHYAPPAPLEV